MTSLTADYAFYIISLLLYIIEILYPPPSLPQPFPVQLHSSTILLVPPVPCRYSPALLLSSPPPTPPVCSIKAMAGYPQSSFDFYQPSPSTVDSKNPFSEDDEMSVLDDKILDSTSPGLSSISDHRRSSYERASDAFSHRDSVWSDFSPPVSSALSRQSSHVRHAVFESAANPFMRVDAAHPTHAYGQHPSWPVSKDSGSCTPTGPYEQLPSELDHASSAAAPFSDGAAGPVSAINVPPMSFRSGMDFPPTDAAVMPPQSGQGWIPASTDMADAVSRSVKSPTCRAGSPLSARRDGIRKKNARFEIPAERTLSNIDHLISRSTNEEEVKELKQQKRLLRNRQAA